MSIDGHSWSEELPKPRVPLPVLTPVRPQLRPESAGRCHRPSAGDWRRGGSEHPPPRRGGFRETTGPRQTRPAILLLYYGPAITDLPGRLDPPGRQLAVRGAGRGTGCELCGPAAAATPAGGSARSRAPYHALARFYCAPPCCAPAAACAAAP